MARADRRIRGFLGAAVLVGSLSACGLGGGVYVDMGSHAEQDEAMFRELSENYPELEFTCIGSEIRNVHQVEASDGTEFTVWVMALRRGEWQIREHYAEDWLLRKGWYASIAERAEAAGLSARFYTANYYPHNFEIDCGELTEESLGAAMQVVSAAKEEFDALMPEFMELSGAEAIPDVSFFVRFTKNGTVYSKDLPMGTTTAIYHSYGPYDYERYFDYYMDESNWEEAEGE